MLKYQKVIMEVNWMQKSATIPNIFSPFMSAQDFADLLCSIMYMNFTTGKFGFEFTYKKVEKK